MRISGSATPIQKATPVFGNIPDLIGRDFDDVIHRLWPREAADELVRLFRHTLETGEPYGELEYSARRIDRGGTEHYEWRINRIPLPDGRFGVVCYFQDVSARVHGREEVERSEARFRAFVTATSDVIYQISPDWSEMRQLQGRDFIADTTDPSRSWLDRYVHPNDHEMVLRAIAEAIHGKTMFELEHRVIRVDGSLGWTYSRAVPRLGADGEVIEWFGAARDVSARKLAEEKVARLTAESEHQRRLYEAIVSSTPDLVYIFNREHRFVFANDALLKMWGKTREEALRKNCLELGYEPGHAEMHDREIEEAVSSRRAVRGEVPFNGTAGRRIYDYIFVPVVSANGEVELVAGTTRDVTDRKMTEEELRRANQDLEQFAYSASHDLKEPLRTVKIYSELLGTRYRDKLDGRALDFLENVQTGADRMEALVRDLLVYTQTSVADTPSEPTDATAALEAALANLKTAIAESGGLVQADALPFVTVHATQLQSLFQNLIGNALMYRRPEVDPVVKITAQRQDNFWLFCVADNGIGIEPESGSRSLDSLNAYTRATNIQEPVLVWPYASASSSAIMAASGSNPKPARAAASTSRSLDETPMESAPRVLVIEDSKTDVFLIREALESAGVLAEIDVVHDGQAALRFLDEEAQPALVLLDLNLPKYSGREILRHIRTNLRMKDLAVLVVTSSTLSQDREDLAALGFEGYFQKPSDYAGFLTLGPLVKGLLEREK